MMRGNGERGGGESEGGRKRAREKEKRGMGVARKGDAPSFGG